MTPLILDHRGMDQHIAKRRRRMKTGLLGLLGLLWMASAMAQTIVARLDLDRRDPEPQFIESVAADGGLITLANQSRKSSRYLALNKYDDEFKKTWSKQVLQQNGHCEVDLTAVLGEDIYVFISEYLPRERSVRTTYSHFDIDGNAIGQRLPLTELPNEKEHRVDLKYVRSINKKKLLCYKNLEEGTKQETILYYLFDAKADAPIPGKIVIPYPDDKFQVRKIMVSNAGKVYVLGKFFKVNKAKAPDDFVFKIYQYEAGEPEGKDVSVDLGELYITDLTLKIDRDENLFLAGFYSHQSTEAIIGTCFFRFNSALEEEVRSSQHFSEDFLANFLRDKQIERGRELQNFYLDNIILRSDGGVLMIAEKFYTTFNSYVDIYGYWVDQKIYHYDEVIVSSVSSTGDLEWSAVVPKRQQSERREGLSYLDVVSGDHLFLIYGYQPRKDPRTMYVNSVDFDGKVDERNMLITNNSMDDSFFPRYSEQISNTEALLVYVQERDKIFSVVKMSFE